MGPTKSWTCDASDTQEADTAALLWELECQTGHAVGVDQRKFPRLKYRVATGLSVLFHRSGGLSTAYTVTPRNISRSGIAFLHNSFTEAGTRCVVKLPTIEGGSLFVQGRIARCRQIRGPVHEFGVEFDQSLDLNHHLAGYLGCDSIEDDLAPPRFDGKVLYVEEPDDDRELARFVMSELGVELNTVSDASQAAARAREGTFDLVLISTDLESPTAEQIAQELRDNGYVGPLVACTSDESPVARSKLMTGSFDDLLVKPFDYRTLVDFLTDYLPRSMKTGSALEPLFSSKWSDVRMRDLILRFLGRLEQRTQRMRQLVEAEDTQSLRKLCTELKTSAMGHGYEQIGTMAQELEHLIGDWLPADRLKAKIDDLADLCNAACVVRKDTPQATRAVARRQ